MEAKDADYMYIREIWLNAAPLHVCFVSLLKTGR